MALTINDTAPDFMAQTTEGELLFHDWNRRLVGGALLAPEGLHARVHDRARVHGQDEEEICSDGWESPPPYIRIVPQP